MSAHATSNAGDTGSGATSVVCCVSTTHREHVTTWWIEVFGGPADYTVDLGGYETMLHHHLNLAITAEQGVRFVELMSRAADDAELPFDPEFRAALIGYLEWGTRIAMHNSQPDAPVVPHAPVPHWGWGVAPPYRPSIRGGSRGQ